jgi:hypothetical protein
MQALTWSVLVILKIVWFANEDSRLQSSCDWLIVPGFMFRGSAYIDTFAVQPGWSVESTAPRATEGLAVVLLSTVSSPILRVQCIRLGGHCTREGKRKQNKLEWGQAEGANTVTERARGYTREKRRKERWRNCWTSSATHKCAWGMGMNSQSAGCYDQIPRAAK